MKLKDFKDRHKGEEMIVVCNGPGLKNIPWAFLESRPYIAINYFTYWGKFMRPDYWIAVDPLCFENVDWTDCPKFIKQHHEPRFNDDQKKQIVFYRFDDQIPGLLTTEDYGLSYSTSAIGAAHLCHYMGASKVLLVGFDCTHGNALIEHHGLSQIPHWYDPRVHFFDKAHSWDKDFGSFLEWVEPRGTEIINLSIPTFCVSLPLGDYRDYWEPPKQARHWKESALIWETENGG